MGPRHVSLSVVSVWNDESVRRRCLDRSLEALRHTVSALEYLPVDNRGQRHVTAGAALNEGVRAATNDVVAFVQQDIYLHSGADLARAGAALLDDPRLGLVGAVGIGSDGRIRGRIRDRVVMIGECAEQPVRVDSVDEVLLLARRRDLMDDPLSEDPALAWHAYGVEYGLRQRSRGREVVALDIPLSHNSLSTNLARLDEAHAAVAAMYPSRLPTRTTCGTISAATPQPETPPRVRFGEGHRWRWRWAKASWAARAGGRAAQSRSLVLGDLRRDVDRIAAAQAGTELRIHNVVPPHRPFPEDGSGTRLRRRSYDVWFTSGPLDGRLPLGRPDETVVLTNVSTHDLVTLRPTLASAPHVIGYHNDIGFWVLTGPVAGRAHEIWDDPRSQPVRVPV